MTLTKMARGHAAEIRARLMRPPNAVPDRGIDLGGKAIAAARAEIVQRGIIEHNADCRGRPPRQTRIGAAL